MMIDQLETVLPSNPWRVSGRMVGRKGRFKSTELASSEIHFSIGKNSSDSYGVGALR